MDWKKITEQVVTIVIAGLLMAFGSTVVWGVKVILDHERQLIIKDGEIQNLQAELERAKSRDKELIGILAEEIKGMQSVAPTPEPIIGPMPIRPSTSTFIKPERPSAADKLFPDKVEEYQRILRDKFEQRTEQHQLRE